MRRACSTHGKKRNAYNILVGKSEGNTALGRPRRKWEDNIKRDLREILWGSMDWTELRIGTSGGSCEHGNEPSVSIKCWEIVE
jgi:hypothetical protein